MGDSLWRFVQLVGDPGVDPEHAGGVTCLMLPGTSQDPPRRSWKALLGRGTSGLPYLACCHRDLAPDKQKKMDGWVDLQEEKTPLKTSQNKVKYISDDFGILENSWQSKQSKGEKIKSGKNFRSFISNNELKERKKKAVLNSGPSLNAGCSPWKPAWLLSCVYFSVLPFLITRHTWKRDSISLWLTWIVEDLYIKVKESMCLVFPHCRVKAGIWRSSQSSKIGNKNEFHP